MKEVRARHLTEPGTGPETVRDSLLPVPGHGPGTCGVPRSGTGGERWLGSSARVTREARPVVDNHHRPIVTRRAKRSTRRNPGG